MDLSDNQLLEKIKDRATQNLLQFIYSASKGQEYVNINSLRKIIEDIVTAASFEATISIRKSLEDLRK